MIAFRPLDSEMVVCHTLTGAERICYHIFKCSAAIGGDGRADES